MRNRNPLWERLVSPQSNLRLHVGGWYSCLMPRTRKAVVCVVVLVSALLGFVVARALGDAEEVVLFRVTAYCPCEKCCGSFADGFTASGTRADHPLVAAPKRFPFGTRLRVPGYAGGRWVRVEDRGGAIKGNRLDVFFNTHKAALRWGVRWIRMRVKGDCDGR